MDELQSSRHYRCQGRTGNRKIMGSVVSVRRMGVQSLDVQENCISHVGYVWLEFSGAARLEVGTRIHQPE